MYKCVSCGEFFTLKCQFILHLMVHAGVKPHRCETCGKSFTDKYELNSHMLIHSEGDPHLYVELVVNYLFLRVISEHIC